MERFTPGVPSAATAERVKRLIGEPVHWTRALGGFAPTERWVVRLVDGSTVFVKLGASEYTCDALRSEAQLLPAFAGSGLAPEFLGFEDGDPPMLWMEDLSGAQWPPPWDARRIDGVLETLRRLRTMPAPAAARPADRLRQTLDHWADLQADPAGFLGLGLATPGWLAGNIGALTSASMDARLEGDETLHLDVRSDNICFPEGRTVLVDWNFVSVGNGDFDLAAWLGSLHAEGGPLPETILPGAGREAAFLAGYFAWTAGRPPVPEAPRLRQGQLSQLRAVLPWACRELGLPEPDLMGGATR